MSFPCAPSFAAALLCLSATAFAQQNILPDPGFEAPENSTQLHDGWWVYAKHGDANAVLDKTVSHSGKQSARLSGTPDARFVFLSPKMQVAEEDELVFSGWLRCDHAQSTNDAGISIMFRAHDGRIVGRAVAMPNEIKPGEWMLLKASAKAPAQAATADFDVFCSNMVGSVWADDVSAVITSPQSLYLENQPKPWPGRHELEVRVINREATAFNGTIRVDVGESAADVSLAVPKGSAQKVKVPITLSTPGHHRYSISLLDKAGKPLRSLEGRFQISEPLTIFPACPCYLNVGTGTQDVQVDARVVVNPAQRAGLKMTASLRDSSGKQIAQSAADASRGEFVETKLRVPTAQETSYTISVQLLGKSGARIDNGETDVHVHPAAESVVTMQKNGFLRVAGESQFPIGMYSCSHYDEMAAGGFTGTHSYSITVGDLADPIAATDIDVKRLLDLNAKYHLRMMVELPRHSVEKAQWAQVKRRVETFKNHPGLLCWGSEERVARGEAPLKNVVALYKLVHQLDPNHPLVLGDTRDVISHLKVDRRDFFPDQAMDAGIWWWYPIPLDGADGEALEGTEKPSVMLEPPSWLTTTFSKKPLWIAIQSYQHPKKDARFPTPAEYRCMAYLSIINKARGLWFYTGSGQRDFYGQPAGLLNKPEEGHWEYVKKLVRELRELSPAIMAPNASGIEQSPANLAIEFSVHQLDHKLYVFAANKSAAKQTAKFRGQFEGKTVRVLYEDHQAHVEGEYLADTFEPFGVHVYCVQ